jgi:hypothetical protein
MHCMAPHAPLCSLTVHITRLHRRRQRGQRVGAAVTAAQVYTLVCKEVGAEPATTLFVDDSARNIAAAHGVGIFSVLVGREGHVVGADAAIPTFASLVSVVPDLFRRALDCSDAQSGVLEGAASGKTIHVPA